MTEQQVKQLLGEPKQVVRRASTRWYYQETPREIHTDPTCGYVEFAPEGKPDSAIWCVEGWVEPDWQKVQAVSQKEQKSKTQN